MYKDFFFGRGILFFWAMFFGFETSGWSWWGMSEIMLLLLIRFRHAVCLRLLAW